VGEYFSLLHGVQNDIQRYSVPYLKLTCILSAGLKQRSVKITTTHILLPRLNEWNFVPINLSLPLLALNINAKERRLRGIAGETDSILG
jgi:hypothetical protein